MVFKTEAYRVRRLCTSFVKASFIAIVFPAILLAADVKESRRADKHLVEVTYACYDEHARRLPDPIRITLYITERWRGCIYDNPDWARQTGRVGDEQTQAKADACLSLLKRLTEPKDLPDAPTQIVTVRCADGDKWITKRFRIDGLPSEVRQILLTMGFSENRFKRLTFTEK
jgi:hypothetical protein